MSISIEEGGIKNLKILHGDNGSTLKGKMLSEKLHTFGIQQTHSRPHVSNDNPYIESFFWTMKTSIKYPKKGFRSKEETIKWISEFVETYNNEKHSGINFVTPNERHSGLEKQILQKRADVKYEAFLKNPIRFANGIEIYEVRNVIPLTPMTVAELKEYLEVNKITDVEGKPLKITEKIFPKKMRKKVKLA